VFRVDRGGLLKRDYVDFQGDGVFA
jgi:hypothetical protein